MRTILSALLLLAASTLASSPVLAAPPPAPPQASFDCGKAASAIERVICADPALAEADRMLAPLYADAQVSAWGAGPSNQLGAQRAWLKERDACATRDGKGEESIGRCLLASYRSRQGDLAVATLFTNPGRSFAVLCAVNPEAAPLYEATYHYTLGLPGDRPRILSLLRPIWDKLHKDEYSGYGASILDDVMGSPDGIIASDAPFGCSSISPRPTSMLARMD